MATLNRSVREHLRKIIDGERLRTARFLVRLRAVGALVYVALNAWLGLGQGLPDWRETLPLFTVYAAVAVALALIVQRFPAALRLAGVSVALLDIPVVSLASLSSVEQMTKPEYLLGALIPMLGALVLLAALSLDYLAIGLAAGVASVFAVVIVRAVNAPPSEYVAPLFSTLSVGILSAFLVSRVRNLVEESRRKDFGGKYVLGERIGSGGMAEVFTATYSPEGGFERRVAVKRVLPAYAEREDFVAMFRREAELGAQLAHPNLVQVLDFGRHMDSWFLAMEFVDGVTLSALLRAHADQGMQVPTPACLFVIAEVAEGLAYLHEKRSSDGTSVGLVHRDLNPPNVLLSRTGEVKVSDFGVARWQGGGAGLTQTGTTRGKLAYMPPEQMEGGPPSPGWDLFALGVTAHELLCGRRLFTGENESQLVNAVLHGAVVPPSTARPGLPADVDALVLGLLERNRASRIASAREVVQRLRALTGPEAPYPHGQEALVSAIARVGSAPLAQAPSAPSPSERGPAKDAPTMTLNRP